MQDSLSLHSTVHFSDQDLDQYVLEDCPYGDLTTHLLGIGAVSGRIAFTTRQETVVCCTEEAARLLERVGCEVVYAEPSGLSLPRGRSFLEATGSGAALHTGWKVAVNLLEAASGIATRTRGIVDRVHAVDPSVEVVATRKVFPGTKRVAIKAVFAGGALPHRLGLSETILVFPQHVALLGGLEAALERIRELKSRSREKKVGVEVEDLKDAVLVAQAGADVIQVDKMDPSGLARLVEAVRAAAPAVVIAAAGGIDEANASIYAATGADVLVTSAMYWGKPADIEAKISPT